MVSVGQLSCPLCCNETFECHDSLKYHLLSISDNLLCPLCGNRFDTIFALAIHIGNKCVEEEDKNTDRPSSEDENETACIKKEVDEHSQQTNSILAKALMRSDYKDANCNDSETQSIDADDSLYYCSSCKIQFVSIEDHIKQYHEGDKILIKDDKDESRFEHLNAELPLLDNEGDSENECKNNEILTSVEECVDKDGMLFTRKLIKIGNFWNNKKAITVAEGENLNDTKIDFAPGETTVEVFMCPKCQNKFDSIRDYDKHKCIGSDSYAQAYKQCKICNACFVNSKYLTTHMKLHNIETKQNDNDSNPPYICQICKTELSSYKALRLHKRMHDPVKNRDIQPPVVYGSQGEQLSADTREMFQCKICNNLYDKEYEEAHKKFHDKEVHFNCNICNRKFYTKENLDMHMRAHTDTKKFTCSYCKKGFLTDDKLQAHVQTKCHERRYECQYCGRRFARPHEKVKHERIHTGEKPHVCGICGKGFRVSYCLTLHLRTHSGTRPYKCNHCGKRFKAHSVYNHHLKTHSTDRKYSCPFCPKTFKTSVQLAGHKNSHTKPFMCTTCNRPFASLYAVRAHMETHQRQNSLKYTCWDCGASYARVFALRDHISEQHGKSDKRKSNSVGNEIGNNEKVRADVTVLPGNDNMLMDIGNVSVENMEMAEVQIIPVLLDGADA